MLPILAFNGGDPSKCLRLHRFCKYGFHNQLLEFYLAWAILPQQLKQLELVILLYAC